MTLILNSAFYKIEKRKFEKMSISVLKLKKLFNSRLPIEEYPIYKVNNGKVANMEMLPDPPIDMGLNHIKYDASSEPRFDASVHLDLEEPAEVSTFEGDNFKTEKHLYKAKPSSTGSQYAYSTPFRVFSREGTRIAREILVNLSQYANHTGRNITLRSIWYVSPFLRDLVLSKEFLGHFEKVFGEPVWPHFYLSNLCLNVGEVGSTSPAG